jgi:hypothetical protein
MRAKQTAGAVAALTLVCWSAGFGLTTVAAADPTPAPPPGPPPAPTATINGTGTYTVGTDITPGTYSSAGPVDNGACYWKRLSGDKIVDNAMSKKPQIIQIDATDTSFKTSDCQPWQKIDDCLPGCAPQDTAPADILGQLGGMILRHPSAPPADGTG